MNNITQAAGGSHYFERKFTTCLILITLIAFFVRIINITFASMWSDELYSMLSVRPDNTFYEMLWQQRRDQPPLYFVVLRIWTQVFGFTDFSARMMSVVIGTMSVFAIGWINEKLYDYRVGLVAALLVAFNFAQIEYSLEVRFYCLLFFFTIVSLYTYYLTQKNGNSWVFHVLHGSVCGAIILSHHFGAFVVLVYGLFDLGAIVKDRFSIERLKYKALAYGVTLLIIVPWFYWSFTSIQTVHDYWLKTIDLGAYLLFNLKYNIGSLIILLLIAGWGIFKTGIYKQKMSIVLILQILLVTALPLAFSIIKFPILVDRYSFALAPALYTLLALGIVGFCGYLGKYKSVAMVIVFVLISADGLYHSFVDRKLLMKEPWKEMATWLKQQKGYPELSVYSVGMYVHKQFSIDYYIPENRAVNILVDSIGLAKLEKFYLVETNAHDRVPDAFKRHLDSNFQKEEIFFGIRELGRGGMISIYKPIKK